MKLKYKDILSVDTTLKLIQVSFATPEKNLAMYEFYSAIKCYQEFLEIEKNKLLRRYGTEIPNEHRRFSLSGDNLIQYRNHWNTTLNIDLPMEIKNPRFTIDDFKSENCSYPNEKEYWPSAADIAALIEFCEKLEKEKEGN